MQLHKELIEVGIAAPAGAVLGRERRHFSLSDWQAILPGVIATTDMALIVAAGLLSFWLRKDTVWMSSVYWSSMLLGAIFIVSHLHLSGFYSLETLFHHGRSLRMLTTSWSISFLVLVSVGFLSKTSEEFSRIWVVLWVSLGISSVMAFRLAIFQPVVRAAYKHNRIKDNIIIVGSRSFISEIGQFLSAIPGQKVSGVFETDSPLARPEPTWWLEELEKLARMAAIDEVIIEFNSMQNSNITAALARLRSLPLNVSLCPARIPSVAFLKVKVVGHHIFLKVLKSPLSGWARVVKRLEDILIGGALLIFFMPLMLSIAIAIKCDSRGPVLFVQRRYGFNNERISVLKFRTMKHDESADASVPQAVRNDPRVTRLGRLLRATSLDELPQLFNVLWGDMSLVGPRPHALAHNEMYGAIIDGYLGRHKVRPGITGWAQINGWRGPTETVEKMKARVEHDLYYIENWSLLLDFKILAQTLFKGFVHPNAL